MNKHEQSIEDIKKIIGKGFDGTYHPERCKLKCDFTNCYAGMGLAGRGKCFLFGMWWSNDCPSFENEDEQIKKSEAAV